MNDPSPRPRTSGAAVSAAAASVSSTGDRAQPLATAAQARASGIAVRVGPACHGWAALSVIVAEGPDAADFLHSQTTNEVASLQPGQGNLGARVERTGHLVAAFSLHRLPDGPRGPRFLLLLPLEDRDRLIAHLDGFLFADDLSLAAAPPTDAVVIVQGPAAEPLIATLAGAPLPEGASVAHRGGALLGCSITGDPGFVFVGPPSAADGVLAECARRGLAVPLPDLASQAIEILRVEAGLIRPAVDLAKRRLLPETGLEQHAVSYTKGCYLGQEVIARVRTYGSVPNALRVLVFAGAELSALPEIGQDLVLDSGQRIGQAASRVDSPVAGAPVLLAFLGRDHRTPGVEHTLRTSSGLLRARVALLPLHRVADRDSRVMALYDRAVQTFAAGDPPGALDLLEQALRLDPAFADGYEAIGVILGRAGRFHEAIDFFQRLGEVAPEEPLVHTNLSLYYMKLGDKPTAEEHSAIAATMAMSRGTAEGRSASEIAAQAQAARRSDAARKERMFRQVLDFDPVDPVALFGLGTALLVLDRFDEAASTLAQAAQVDGKNSAIFPVLGKALEHLGRDDEARAAYRQGIEVASRRGDLMPLKEMQARLLLLGG